MAEVTGLRNNALPYPVYGVPYGITFPILDADGDLVTGAAGLDSERSLNADTFADCTNEATEIATNSGMYYLLLTAAEQTADEVSIIIKTSTSGAKTTPITLQPRKLVPLRSGTAQGGAAGSITLDASAGALNDKWNGCLCVATIDGNVEARIIDDYVGTTQVASVTPNWNVTPDSDDTFIIYLPEGAQTPTAEATSLSEETRSANLLDQLQTIIAVIESQRGHHTHQPKRGSILFIDQNNGDTTANGATGGISDPIDDWQDAHDTYGVDGGHDLYIMVAGLGSGTTIHTEDILPTNRYSLTRAPGRDFIWRPTANNTVAIDVVNTDGCMFSGFQLNPSAAGTGSQNGIEVSGSDFFHADGIWFNATRGSALQITNCDNYVITNNILQGSGASGSGQGIQVLAGNSQTGNYGSICDNVVSDVQGDGIQVDTTGGGTVESLRICGNTIHGSTDDGIDIVDSGCVDTIIEGNVLGENDGSDIEDAGTTTIIANNEQWAKQSLLVYGRFAIHLDTVSGAAGSVPGTNGTRGNPSSNLADADLLNDFFGFDHYHLHGASSILLESPHPNWVFEGQNGATVILGGVNTNGSHFECLTITGDADGNDITTRLCKLQSLTHFIADAQWCLLIDDVTQDAGDHYWFQCASGVAGVGTPHIDIDGDGVNARNNHIRGWMGGLELRTHTSADMTSFDCPAGQIVIAASGTGGTVAMRGNIDVTDNASGAVTLSQNAVVNMTKINTEADTALSDIHLDHLLAVEYDPASQPGVGTALLNELIEDNAGVSRYTAAALFNAPGGAAVVTVTPLSSTISAGAVTDSDLTAYQHAAFGVYIWVIVDSDGTAVDLSGKTIALQAFDPEDTETELWSHTTTGGEITIGGANNNQVTVDADDTNTGTAGAFRYVMRNTTDDSVIAQGNLTFVALPDVTP